MKQSTTLETQFLKYLQAVKANAGIDHESMNMYRYPEQTYGTKHENHQDVPDRNVIHHIMAYARASSVLRSDHGDVISLINN
ncbi:MAG: hypothetical protein R6U62_07335 [Bacteroidales bacterium]